MVLLMLFCFCKYVTTGIFISISIIIDIDVIIIVIIIIIFIAPIIQVWPLATKVAKADPLTACSISVFVVVVVLNNIITVNYYS